MPSTITHAYIGLDTLKKLSKKPKELISNHLNNYKIYCQNMDILYFYHILLLKKNKIQSLGHRFHNEDILHSFKILIDDNKKNKNPELFTFIAGLITHYQADATMHPFIDYQKNYNPLFKRDGHFILETYLDNYYIREKVTNNYPTFDNSKIIFNYKKEDIIEKEITKIFKEIWNFDNMGKYYYRALKEMHFVFHYLRYDKYQIKKFFYKIIDLIPVHHRKTEYLSYHFYLNHDVEMLNLNHQEWFNINDNKKTSYKSFLELYEDVCNQSSIIINELYEYIFNDKQVNIEKLVGNNSYSDGLPIKIKNN